MAKNKPIEYHRITSRHKESPERILSEAKKIVEGNKDKEIRFMLTDQKGDSVNETIRKSGYTYRINKASKYDAKNLTRGAKLRTQAELKGGVKYHRLGEGYSAGGHDKHWSDRFKHLKDTNPSNTYDPDTGKLLGRAVSQFNKPKDILLDEIGDTDDPEMYQAGLDFVKRKYKSFEKKQYTDKSKDIIPWLNKDQLDKYNRLKGRPQYNKIPEGTILTKDFDTKTLVPEATNYEYFTEKGTEGVDKLDFDPNSGPRRDEFDELPLHDDSLNSSVQYDYHGNEIKDQSQSEYVEEHYTKSLRLPDSGAGIDPDKVKGKFKVAKTNLKIASKVAKSFVKGKYKTQTAIIENEGKFNLNTNRPDISGKEELRPAIDLFRKGNKQVSVPEEGRIDNVVAQATENKPKVSSKKKVTAIRKHTGETTSVKEITTKKKVNVPAQKSMITSGRGVTTSHANKPKPVSPSNTVFPKQTNYSNWTFQKKFYEGAGDKLSKEQSIAKRAKNAPTFKAKKGRVKIYTKTKNVTTEVTPKLKKVTSTAKPSKKVVTAASTRGETVATRIQKRFATKPGSSNIERKYQSTAKKHGSVGKGIKFTRGLGAFSILSSILAPLRGRKEARQELGREPTVLETLHRAFIPKHIRDADKQWRIKNGWIN
jgi:hypothetical protein